MKTMNMNPTNMYFKIVMVTPELAENLLETNERNRTPNKDKLAKIIYDIQHGSFDAIIAQNNCAIKGNKQKNRRPYWAPAGKGER